MSEDERQLDLLATFHFVVGGIGVFFACFPLMHFFIGLAALSGSLPVNSGSGQGMPVFMGVIFTLIGGTFFVVFQCLAWTVIACGRFIKRRQRHTFTFVLACIQCCFVPFGTVLGVFTIVVLSRESVKKLYANSTPPEST